MKGLVGKFSAVLIAGWGRRRRKGKKKMRAEHFKALSVVIPSNLSPDHINFGVKTAFHGFGKCFKVPL